MYEDPRLSKGWLFTAYFQGMRTITSIASEIGCSSWTVRERLLKYGIAIRTRHDYHITKPIEYRVDAQGCWICTSHYPLFGRGYCLICRGKKRYTLHRYMYMIPHGLSDEDMRDLVVMHTCDNPACININVDHLRLGTQKDNLRDMVIKGRARW